MCLKIKQCQTCFLLPGLPPFPPAFLTPVPVSSSLRHTASHFLLFCSSCQFHLDLSNDDSEGYIGGVYSMEETLARGAFATVFQGTNARTYERVALKQVQKNS